MTRKLLGLIGFIATGIGIMISTIVKDMNPLNTGFLVIVSCFFIISLVEHYNELKS